MSKLITKTTGFLAPDGTIFPTEIEALKYHFSRTLDLLCKDSGIPPLSFSHTVVLWDARFDLARIIMDLE